MSDMTDTPEKLDTATAAEITEAADTASDASLCAEVSAEAADTQSREPHDEPVKHEPRSRTGKRRARRRRLIKGWLTAAAVTLAAVAVIFGLMTDVRPVADGGMSPTLLEGDTVMISRISRYLRTPKRGDMVVYISDGAYMMARIIALPNERVRIKNGSVYINGMLLNETGYTAGRAVDCDELVLAANRYLLLPDSRDGVPATETGADDMYGLIRLICRPAHRIAWFQSS